MDSNAEPVVVQQTYNSPIAVVWKAITDNSQMRQWFFEPMTDFEPVVGFETQFNVRVNDQDYLHVWKVTEVEPEKRISYNWKYPAYPGDSSVTWELSESAQGTQLKLTHEGIETFPQDNPIFSRQNTQAGWEYFVRDSLKAFLES